jgi:hypothetical protein
MLLFLFAKEKVTKKKNRGLVIFYEVAVLWQGQLYPKIPDAAFRTVIKGSSEQFRIDLRSLKTSQV